MDIMTDLNDLLKHTSRSLYLSARLLPRSVRDAFCVAYLLCRYADSIADTSLIEPAKRLTWIQQFPTLILQPQPQKVQTLIDDISSSASTMYEEKLLRHFIDCVAEFKKLDNWKKELILTVVQAVCAGMKIDLQTFPAENSGGVAAFQTQQELEHYCHLMGGAPGIFWSELLAHTVKLKSDTASFLKLGEQIGDALQIVNILRDLPRDLRIGRCYFPQADLQTASLSAQDLFAASSSSRFEPIKQKWIAWGREKLSAAHEYLASIPKTQPRHRAAVAWPVLWAADTLNKLEQEKNLLDTTVRVKIPRSRIYGTMLATPPVLFSNFLFSSWLRTKIPNEK
ncbi:MAG: squalene/phytoene synthase family protein [Elusimicrobiaceae bacterium]|nr:squalene/phytoene synthase family protein [Elusimicrobiaceae bacterium]